MSEERSWKDIRNQRRKENFVGRGDEMRIFTENFAASPKYMIFAVTGEGGVGKSTLLKRFAGIAISPEVGANVITCDDRQTSPVSAMGHIAIELAKQGISHKEFDERHKTYLQLRQEIESDPKVPRSAVKVFSMGITDFTIKSLRKTPGVGVFFEYTDEKAAGEALGELIQYSINKWGNKDEVQLLREPENILTPLFLKLIQKASENKRLVIMFDVFERTGDILISWLLALFNFEYGEFGTNLSFVISGRDSLDQQWTELAGMICYIRLEPFTLEETKLYLGNQEIVDVKLVEQIHNDTGGLPVLVELLAATKPQPGEDLADISKDAVERFLQWTPQEDKRRAALIAAVPRQFNRDILDAVLDEKADEMFNWLAGQSYIRRASERGWFYHEKVRELMLRYTQRSIPSLLAESHSKLSEYFSASQAKLILAQEEAYNSETWSNLELERIYHLLSAGSEQNIPNVLNAFLHAFRWKWQFANNIAKICQQVAVERELRNLQIWADILSELYLAYERDEFQKVAEYLNKFDSQRELTKVSQSCLFARRGIAYRNIGKTEESLVYFNQAIEFDKKYKWAIAQRGITYRTMMQYEKAIADLNSAIKLDNKYKWAIAQRGLTYREMERYEEAISDFNRAVELDEKYIWAITQRGLTYQEMERYEEAISDLNRAIELDEKYAWAISIRGLIYREIEKYEEAIADFNRAIELDEKYTWAIAQRGLTYREMEKYEEAISDLNRAIELDEKYAWAISIRGLVYREIEKYEEAISDFNRAIELDGKYAWAIAQRGLTYREMKKYEEAISDFNRAIELDEKDAWVFVLRGGTYRLMKKDGEALSDFSRVIELDEKDVFAVVQRGITYQKMKKYEEAISDFNRAIELDEKYAWAIAQRGLTYREMKKYEEALSDFSRAIELDEKYAWATAQRGLTYRMMARYEEALLEYNNAIKLNDKYEWAITGRAITYRLMGKFENALADFKRAFELSPQNVSWMGNYAGALLGNGQFDEGIALLEKTIEIFESTNIELASELWFYAFAHWEPSRRKDALQKLKQVLQNGGRSPEWDFSDNILQAKKDKHTEIVWLEKLADVITNKTDISVLDKWDLWKRI